MKILMVGYSVGTLRWLEQYLHFSVTVVEEPDLYVARKLERHAFSCVKNVLFGEYQQSTGYQSLLEELQEQGFDVVLPGLEYAVPAAAWLAQALGLRGAGKLASEVLTNKYRLRLLCQEYNVPHPRFAKVETLEELKEFYRCQPIVLKPANRQASLGVLKIQALEEIEGAWQEVRRVDEGNQVAKRDMKWEYLVEECLVGTEISSEVLVLAGEIFFFNVTEKSTTTGRYSVEMGHVVPGSLPQEQEEQVRELMHQLVQALQFDSGVLHAEWMLTATGPQLIECAGRAPGDSIFELIQHAYGVDPYLALIHTLAGRKSDFPVATKAAAIHFFNAVPGIVTSITGVETLEHVDVVKWKLSVKVGEEVKEITNSWDRIGYLMVSGTSPTEAKALAARLNAHVSISTVNPTVTR